LDDELKNLKSILLNEYPATPDVILTGLVECISSLPWKASIYANLAVLLMAENAGLVQNWISQVKSCLLTNLISALTPESLPNIIAAHRSRLVHAAQFVQALRFLAHLVPVSIIAPDAWILFLESWIQAIHRLSSWRIKDLLIYTIMSTFVINGSVLNDKASDAFQKLFSSVEGILASRPKEQLLLASSLNQLDKVQDLFQRILSLKNENAWAVVFLKSEVLNTDAHFIELSSIDSFDGLLLSELQSPEIFIEGFNFQLKDPMEGDVSLGYSMDSIERWYVADVIHQTFILCSHNHRKLFGYLFDLARFYEGHDGLFERYIVETLVRDMFNLANKPFPWIAYGTVLADLLNSRPEVIAKPLGEVIHKLFYGLPLLTPSQRRLFAEWMAHHLSQFDFVWNWDLWHTSLQAAHLNRIEGPSAMQTDNVPMPVITNMDLSIEFLKLLITQLIRLSYYERIKETIPQYFTHLLPSPPQPLPIGISDLNLEEFKDVLSTAIQNKDSVESLEALLLSMPDSPTEDFAEKKVFLTCLLSAGNKSFSHCLNVVERYNLMQRII
jgi:nuclear cap-binding protein subunit 1